jgi:hypothetical protein
MNRIELLLQGWDFSYEKEDWYPPLLDALQGVTAAQADWCPEGYSVNTIWENVHHLIFYKERLLFKWAGEEAGNPEGLTNDDTFAVKTKGDQAWEITLARLDYVNKGIHSRLADLKEEQLENAIPGRKLEEWAHSLIRHDAYHTGEIIMLRKMQGSWPSRRSFD